LLDGTGGRKLAGIGFAQALAGMFDLPSLGSGADRIVSFAISLR
jgi:hypothetical protein